MEVEKRRSLVFKKFKAVTTKKSFGMLNYKKKEKFGEPKIIKIFN